MTKHGARSGVLGLAVVLSAGALGGACSSSSGSPQRDAAAANSDGGCLEGTVAEACAAAADAGFPCVLDWPADPRAFCSLYPTPASPAGTTDRVGDCDGYRVFAQDGPVDNGSANYYSATTGKLIAITAYHSSDPFCLAGPPGFVPPSGCGGQELVCSDAGTDGGADASGSGGT